MAEHEEDEHPLLTEEDKRRLKNVLERSQSPNPLRRWWKRGRDRLVRNRIELLHKSLTVFAGMAIGFGVGDVWIQSLALNRMAESSVPNVPSLYEQAKDKSIYRDIMGDADQDEIDRAIRGVFVNRMQNRIKAGDNAWGDRQNWDGGFILGGVVGLSLDGLLHRYRKWRSEQADS